MRSVLAFNPEGGTCCIVLFVYSHEMRLCFVRFLDPVVSAPLFTQTLLSLNLNLRLKVLTLEDVLHRVLTVLPVIVLCNFVFAHHTLLIVIQDPNRSNVMSDLQ